MKPELLLSRTVDGRVGGCWGRGVKPSGVYYKHGLVESAGGTGPVSGISLSPAYLSNKQEEQVTSEGSGQG